MIIYNTIKALCMFVVFNRSTQGFFNNESEAYFNADSDALIIGNALFADTESNKEIIAHLIVDRSNVQRQMIKKAFYSRYREDLVVKIDVKFSSTFQETIDSLMVPKRTFYARELHKAVTGIGTDERTINEILGVMNNSEILEVSNVYKNVYGKTLKDDLSSDTSGNFQNLLMALCNAYRDEDGPVDYEAANEDAHFLYDAIFQNYEMEETFIMVMTSRSYSQLRAIFKEYEKITKINIFKSMSSRIFDDVYYGLYAIMQSALSRSEFYAKELYDSMLGIGTNNHKLIRIVVGRSENDLRDIKQTYEKIYGKPLVVRIDEDTSGDYNYMLRTLVENS